MKFSREMKDYFRESMGNSLTPNHAADYLISLFLDEAWKGRDYDRGDNPSWGCLLDSKAYRDMVATLLKSSKRHCSLRWTINATPSIPR